MLRFFTPRPLMELAPRWGDKIVNTYPLIFGFSPFAHLFVCNAAEDSFAVVVTEKPELVELNVRSRGEFNSDFAGNSNVKTEFFREPDYLMLCKTLGAPGDEDCFFPGLYPAIGGFRQIETYQRGNIWVHLDIYGQTLGFV